MILSSLEFPGLLDHLHSVLPFLVLLAEFADHIWRGRWGHVGTITSSTASTGAIW